MIFSSKFFLTAAVVGIALAGISIDPALLSFVSQLHYARLFDPQYRVVSIPVAVVVGLIGLGQYRKRKNLRREQRSEADLYRSSHPFNK